jgi:hypothetical protein
MRTQRAGGGAYWIPVEERIPRRVKDAAVCAAWDRRIKEPRCCQLMNVHLRPWPEHPTRTVTWESALRAEEEEEEEEEEEV